MNTTNKTFGKTLHKDFLCHVYKAKISELKLKHLSRNFSKNKFDEDFEVFIKCDKDGDIDYREVGHDKYQYRIIPVKPLEVVESFIFKDYHYEFFNGKNDSICSNTVKIVGNIINEEKIDKVKTELFENIEITNTEKFKLLLSLCSGAYPLLKYNFFIIYKNKKLYIPEFDIESKFVIHPLTCEKIYNWKYKTFLDFSANYNI